MSPRSKGSFGEIVLPRVGALFVPGHEHHERSLVAFSAANRSGGYCAAHCLAEVYATLTRLPGKYRAAPEQAVLCLETIEERLNVVALRGCGMYFVDPGRCGDAYRGRTGV